MQKKHFVLSLLSQCILMSMHVCKFLFSSYPHWIPKDRIWFLLRDTKHFMRSFVKSSRFSKWRMEYIFKYCRVDSLVCLPWIRCISNYNGWSVALCLYKFLCTISRNSLFLVIASNHSLRPTLVEAKDENNVVLKSTQKQNHIYNSPSRGD